MSFIDTIESDEKCAWNMIFVLSCVVVAISSRRFNDEIVIWINVLAIVFLTHLTFSNNCLLKIFETCIVARNSSRLCFLNILFFLLQTWINDVQSSMTLHRRRVRLISLTTRVHSSIQLVLIISCDLIHEIDVSIVFFNASSNVVVYSSRRWRFVVSFDNDFERFFLMTLSNFSMFMIFQLRREHRDDFFCVLRFNIVLIKKWSNEFFILSSISQYISLLVISDVVKNKSIVVRAFW